MTGCGAGRGALARLMRYPPREARAAAIVSVPLIAADDVVTINRDLHRAGQTRCECPSAVERDSHDAPVIGPDVDLLAHDFPLALGVSPCRYESADGRSHQVLQPFVQLRRSASGEEQGAEYRGYGFHTPFLARPANPQRAVELKRQRNNRLSDIADFVREHIPAPSFTRLSHG